MDVINTSGRRKTAVARIYMSQGNGKITINGRELNNYFKTNVLVYKVLQPLELTNNQDKFDIKVNLEGGGITGQAEALRLAISKALVEINNEYRPVLKQKGLLTRDPRMVERKKPGRPKARKRFQFSKR
ncbi:MAG TPA: 30S ribosomal protein S9 [Bacteroidales bacterium]|mgnify:CR=1 FL=1|jgi:small subunit ribosomal protein S9|nr:MAG: 30S ribosomal protein S9 [Bacteroidetes bacterium 38_7]HAL65727.1 30S ribosomal protein S9 [Bacteroidales bacterium]HAW58811.1 30S ribosomal protein S9 [Bacteroidales bacterium]HQN98971.1 30S ribosomal protein S9 [Bacteroidales bacterium]HQQ02939.1 30S ribosomal protein S9 [Bacteroidales bacterium]